MKTEKIGNKLNPVRHAVIAAGLLLSVACFGQTVRGNFDLTAYPEVSFVWNDYNPEQMNPAQFILTLDGGKIPFNVRNLIQSETIANKDKTVLFLWEDLNHKSHAKQSDFIRAVLLDFLTDAGATGRNDKFNIAVFDRRGGNDGGKSSIHMLLSNGFTSDRQQLAAAVGSFPSYYDGYSRQQNSELYLAIEEGIELLAKEPSDRVRVIVVFTAGSNLDNYGGRNSINENHAVALKIPVYAVKYPVKGCEHCTNIDVICKQTYGQAIATDDRARASSWLAEIYEKMSVRHSGTDYRISFVVPNQRDGKQHSIILNINGKEYPLTFVSPPFSIKTWMAENLLPVIFAGAIFLALVVLAVALAVRKVRKVRKRNKEMLEFESKQRQTQYEADANRRDLETFRKQKENEERDACKREQTAYLAKIMQAKNMYPRLQYSFGSQNFTYTVSQPETSIGRESDNDLVIPLNSISRHHVRIAFNGSGFEIQDLGSANKVVVNGVFVQRAALANGDTIGLGEVVFYFFN